MKIKWTLNRRSLIKTGLGIAAGSVLPLQRPATAGTTIDAPSDTARVLGAPPSKLGERSPSVKLERLVPAPVPSGVSLAPLERLNGIITPSDLHFERHHAGVPSIDPRQYKLLIHGMVDRPRVFTLEDLQRFPAESRTCFIECSGNGFRASLLPDKLPRNISATQLDGLLSTSEWTGVRLATLFHEVGVKPEASWFLAEGGDAALMSRSIPVHKAWGDALLAYAQNGEPLRPGQGYPVRLLLPGWEGNTNVKWLRRLELSDAPFMTRDETSKYSDAMADGRVEMFTFLMGVKSLITFPSYGQGLRDKGWHEVRGLAWSGVGKIARVDVSVDAGKNWQAAALQAPVLDKCTTRFRFGWDWNGEETIIMSRALDEGGNRQLPYAEHEKKRGPRTFYHNNAIRAWKIHKDGSVTFGLRDLLT